MPHPPTAPRPPNARASPRARRWSTRPVGEAAEAAEEEAGPSSRHDRALAPLASSAAPDAAPDPAERLQALYREYQGVLRPAEMRAAAAEAIGDLGPLWLENPALALQLQRLAAGGRTAASRRRRRAFGATSRVVPLPVTSAVDIEAPAEAPAITAAEAARDGALHSADDHRRSQAAPIDSVALCNMLRLGAKAPRSTQVVSFESSNPDGERDAAVASTSDFHPSAATLRKRRAGPGRPGGSAPGGTFADAPDAAQPHAAGVRRGAALPASQLSLRLRRRSRSGSCCSSDRLADGDGDGPSTSGRGGNDGGSAPPSPATSQRAARWLPWTSRRALLAAGPRGEGQEDGAPPPAGGDAMLFAMADPMVSTAKIRNRRLSALAPGQVNGTMDGSNSGRVTNGSTATSGNANGATLAHASSKSLGAHQMQSLQSKQSTDLGGHVERSGTGQLSLGRSGVDDDARSDISANSMISTVSQMQLLGKSFGIFTADNAARSWAYQFVTHKNFDRFFLFIILVNCVQMAMERPALQPGSQEWDALHYVDLACTILFCAEVIIKVFAFTFKLYISSVSVPRPCAPASYLFSFHVSRLDWLAHKRHHPLLRWPGASLACGALLRDGLTLASPAGRAFAPLLAPPFS